MNSHERRTTERRWPHCIDINNDDALLMECFSWLDQTMGTCEFRRKNNPRWCWRPSYTNKGFAMYRIGAQIYFRRKEDYAWFLLKWEQ